MQAFPDAVISLLPYAIPVLEERLQLQEVSFPAVCLHHACQHYISSNKF